MTLRTSSDASRITLAVGWSLQGYSFTTPAFSPDGRYFMFGEGGDTWPIKAKLHVRDTVSFEPVGIANVDFLGGGTFTADSKRLIISGAKSYDADSQGVLQLRDFQDGAPIWSRVTPSIGNVARIPGTNQAVVMGRHHEVLLIDVESGAIVQSYRGNAQGAGGFAHFSADGRYLMSCGFGLGATEQTAIWDWNSKEVIQRFQSRSNFPVFAPNSEQYGQISRDGRSLEFTPVDQPMPDLVLAGAGQQIVGLVPDPEHGVLLSVDRSGALRSWSPTTGQERGIRRPSKYVHEMSFCLAKRLMVLGETESLRIVQMDTLDEIEAFPEKVQWWLFRAVQPGRKICRRLFRYRDEGLRPKDRAGVQAGRSLARKHGAWSLLTMIGCSYSVPLGNWTYWIYATEASHQSGRQIPRHQRGRST